MSPGLVNVNPSSENKESDSESMGEGRIGCAIIYCIMARKIVFWRAINNFNYYFKTLNVMLRTSMHKNRVIFMLMLED